MIVASNCDCMSIGGIEPTQAISHLSDSIGSSIIVCCVLLHKLSIDTGDEGTFLSSVLNVLFEQRM